MKHFLFYGVFCIGFGAINALKFVTFGDSTIENDGCTSLRLGVPFPPSPPYSQFDRFSSDLSWVDYFEDVYGAQVIPCACGTSLASKDTIFNPFENSTTAQIPGLVSQVDICVQNKGLVEEVQKDEVIAIIQSGGNDLLDFVTTAGTAPITEESFASGFEESIRKLVELGITKIFAGSSIYQVENPRIVFTQENFPALFPFFEALGNSFQNAFEAAIASLQDEGLPVQQLPVTEFLVAIRTEADKQGINSRDSCIDPGSPWGALEILPDCSDFNKRLFFDSVHFADWGHQQYARVVTQYFQDIGILPKNNIDIEEEELLEPVQELL
eukprot:TRINITY_DN3021_c0_g1_i2.p2 TRINITY_DN3021_c0_g1~~TRINITY_DN3021_c0_g1_i2.p2  ORF type:complete len:326 (+),score=65.90 TRINITY_DN3021_c0_g1_i2:142-1119(+)